MAAAPQWPETGEWRHTRSRSGRRARCRSSHGVLVARPRPRSQLPPAQADEPVPAPPHLAKRGRFSPAAFAAHQQQAAHLAKRGRFSPAAFAAHQQQAAHLAKRGRFSPAPTAFAAHQQQAATAAAAEAAALREENGVLRARAEVLKRGVAEQHRRQEALERDNGVLKHGVAALHRREEAAQRAVAESKAREEEARREVAELRKKVAELEAANYALAARMLGTDSCRFQTFHGPDVIVTCESLQRQLPRTRSSCRLELRASDP